MEPGFTSFMIILLFIGLPFLIWASSAQKEELAKNNNKRLSGLDILVTRIKEINNFERDDYIYNQGYNYGIAIDNTHKKFCIVTRSSTKLYNYNDLLGVELIENGETLTKSLRGSQIAGAAVGGLLLGGAGAIIGGLSGKKETIKLINNIEIKLTLNDTEKPIFDFVFFRRNNKKDNPSIQMNKAKKWNSLLNAIILQKDANNTGNINNQESLSVADEILKLKTLKDDGVITNDEFTIQKNKLLG
jgi:hypothetical protein